MNVLHIGNEMSWRGGENQIRFLIEGQKSEKDIHHFIAYPKDSRGIEVFSKSYNTLELPSRNADHPLSVFKLVQYAKKNNIDIIDAQSSGGHSLALWVKRFLPKIKLIVHRRVDNIIKTNFISKRKYLHPSVDKYIAISDCIGRILKDYGVPENKIEIVHSAVDPKIYESIDPQAERTRIGVELGIPQDEVWVGNASAFTAQKDPVFLMKALNQLNKNKVSYHCLLAGDGVLLEQCKGLALEYGIEDRVHFLGHIQKVPQLLSALDILLFPSANEGLGTLLLDSISAGTAVVATRVGGISEIIIDQKTGLSVEPGDLASYVNKATELIKSPKLRLQLVTNAQRHIEREFSISNMVAGNLKTYRAMLNQQ